MENQEEYKIDLGKYLGAFCRSFRQLWKFFVLILVACVVLLECKTALRFRTTYSSRAMFIASTSGNTDPFSNQQADETFVSDFGNLLRGPMMRKMLVKELGLDMSAGFPAVISVSPVPETALISMKVTSADAELSYNIANFILEQYGEVTQKIMSDASLTVVDTPMLAEHPDAYPDYVGSFVKALILGVLLCVVILCVHAVFRGTIIDRDDIENKLHLKMLTRVMYQPNHKKTPEALLLTNPHVSYAMRKSFYDVRMAMEKKRREDGSQVFLFTSAMPNEGKTMAAINTALSLTKHGSHVVLVDLDLRNPSVMSSLQGEKLKKNVVDYLQNQAQAEEILQTYKESKLDLICMDNPVENVPELLESDRFAELLGTLRKQYDYVILDLPPMHIIQDTFIAAKQADGAIVVMKQDYVKCIDELDVLDELNGNVKCILGAILNQVKLTPFDSEPGHYGHGYGYGYGYGYGRRQPKYVSNEGV